MAIIRRIPWTRQPPGGTPLNWGNSILRGLKFCGTFHRGVPWEEVLNEPGVFGSGGGSIEPTDLGLAAQFPLDTTDAYCTFEKHDEIYDGLEALTVLSYAKNRKGIIVSTGSDIPFAHAGGGDDPWFCAWLQSENWIVTIDHGASSSTDTIVNGLETGVGAEPRDWNILGATWDGSTLVSRVNNTWGAGISASGALSAGITLGNQPYIGNNTAGSNASWDGWIIFSLMWNRALSDAEWSSVVNNPFQIYQPRTQIIPTELLAVTGTRRYRVSAY